MKLFYYKTDINLQKHGGPAFNHAMASREGNSSRPAISAESGAIDCEASSQVCPVKE
jgi:hypothetical protein